MNNQRWLSQNFFVFFITWGVFLPYWTGWLVQDKGLDVTQASLVMGFGLVARGVTTLFGFPIIYKYWSSARVILFFTIASLAATIMYIPFNSFSALLIVTLLFNAVYPALLPAVDSAAAVLVQHEGLHYGKSRSYGSIGFVVSVFIVSMLIGYWGEEAILWSMAAGLCLMMGMRLMQTPSVLLAKPEAAREGKSGSVRRLLEIKSFPIVLLVVVLLQAAHASYYNYGFIYLQELHVNNYYIGIIINIAVIFEIFYFAKADHLFSGWRTSSLLLLSAVGSTLRWLLVFLFPNVWVFVLSQSLHALSFGVAHYAFMQYITSSLPREQLPGAQGIYSAIALSWSTAVMTIAGGYLYDLSAGLSFLGMLAVTIPALAVLLATREKFGY